MVVVFSYFYFFFFLFEKRSIKDGPSQEFFSKFSSIFLLSPPPGGCPSVAAYALQ
jgi:hypothetical protein